MNKSILKNELNSGNTFSKWELICLFNTIIDDQKSYIIASDEILDKLVEDLNNDIITHDDAVESIIDLVDDSRFDEFYENIIAICRIADEEFNDYHLTKTVSTFSIQAMQEPLKRAPLSESRIAAIWDDSDKTDVAITRAIEKAHGIGGWE